MIGSILIQGSTDNQRTRDYLCEQQRGPKGVHYTSRRRREINLPDDDNLNSVYYQITRRTSAGFVITSLERDRSDIPRLVIAAGSKR